MKSINKVSIFSMVMLLLISFAFAGITTDVERQRLHQGQTFYTYASMDSAEIDTSRTFSFCHYDAKQYLTFDMADTATYEAIGDFATETDTIKATFSMAHTYTQNFLPVPFAYILTAAVGTPLMSIWIDDSMDASNWILCDTIAASATAETLVYETIDLNDERWAYYRLRMKSEDTGKAAIVKLWFYMYWEREDK